MCKTWNYVSKSGFYVEEPLPFKGKVGDEYKIARSMLCGHCSDCLLQKSRDWCVRNYFARLESPDDRSWSVILTYDNDHNKGIIDYEDVKLYHKRLRKRFTDFDFFCSCEYGDNKGRPHYHILYYNFPMFDYLDLQYLCFNQESGRIIYTSSVLNSIWKNGICRIQPMDMNVSSVYYQTIYQQKRSKWFDLIYASLVDAILSKKGVYYNENLKRFVSIPFIYSVSQYDSLTRESFPSLKTLKYDFPELFDFVSSISERNVSSLSLGFDSFLRNGYEQWRVTQSVYIDGNPYQIPYSWLDKLYRNYDCQVALGLLYRLSEEAVPITNEADMIIKVASSSPTFFAQKRFEREKKSIF